MCKFGCTICCKKLGEAGRLTKLTFVETSLEMKHFQEEAPFNWECFVSELRYEQEFYS